jgi:hypothetical protein
MIGGPVVITAGPSAFPQIGHPTDEPRVRRKIS